MGQAEQLLFTGPSCRLEERHVRVLVCQEMHQEGKYALYDSAIPAYTSVAHTSDPLESPHMHDPTLMAPTSASPRQNHYPSDPRPHSIHHATLKKPTFHVGSMEEDLEGDAASLDVQSFEANGTKASARSIDGRNRPGARLRQNYTSNRPAKHHQRKSHMSRYESCERRNEPRASRSSWSSIRSFFGGTNASLSNMNNTVLQTSTTSASAKVFHLDGKEFKGTIWQIGLIINHLTRISMHAPTRGAHQPMHGRALRHDQRYENPFDGMSVT